MLPLLLLGILYQLFLFEFPVDPVREAGLVYEYLERTDQAVRLQCIQCLPHIINRLLLVFELRLGAAFL